MKKIFLYSTASLMALLILSGCNSTQTDSPDPGNQPPALPSPTSTPKVASISGTLEINGAVVQNTSALMLERTIGEVAYNEFDRMPAVDGATWSYNPAIVGEKYEITVALQVDEQNKATGNVVTTSAPASDLALIVNTDLNLPAPSSAPTVECKDPDTTGGYNPIITYSNVDGAAGYYYQVGTESGLDDVDKGYSKANEDPNQYTTNTTYVSPNTSYYTRYAYTACVDCNVHDTQNWSGWSPTLGFTCPEK